MTGNPTPNDTAAGPPALAWARQYLPHYFTDPPCRFHAELMRVLADGDRRLIARVAPRGHAKSTLAALAYPLWCLCLQKRGNIVIITHEAALATQFVRDIRHELETNDAILAAYGDLCRAPEADTEEPGGRRRPAKARPAARARRKWSEAMFTTTTGITVQAKGIGASLRGTRIGPRRPDLIICDDLEKDAHVQSLAARRKLEHWLRRVVMPALAPGGQLLVLGSILHYDSLLANLRDRERFGHWDYAVYRALEAEPDADGQYYRVALWPARWPVDRLDLERERIGTLAFEAEYQANPIDDSIRIFRPEWLKRYDPSELVPERLTTLMAVDPATGTDGSDFFALWVGSVDQATNIIYTRELTLERIGFVEQVKRIVAAFLEWRPVKIGIETNAYQVALKQNLEEESRQRGLYMPIVGFRSTVNKLLRIQGSAPFYENGMFRLPAVLDPEVESQFLHCPKSGHDDAPDVCAMGIELARSVRGGVRIEGLAARRNPFARRGGW